VDDDPESPVVAGDDDHPSAGVLKVLGPAFIYFVGLFDVFEDVVCLFNVLHIVGLLVGDFEEEPAVDVEQGNAIGVLVEDGVELCLELVLGPGDQSPQVLEPPDVGVGVHYESPEVDVVVGTLFYLVLEFDESVGVVEVFIDLACFVDFLLVQFRHLLLDPLEVV
jgi:hypothetical protein